MESRKQEKLNDAQRRLVEDNVNLVPFCIGKYFPNSPRRYAEDMMSSGYFGLCCAAARFDSGRNMAFCTYAVACIRWRIFNDLRKERRWTRALNGCSEECLSGLESCDKLVFPSHDRVIDRLKIVKDFIDDQKVTSVLTDLEHQTMLAYFVYGYTFDEIADSRGICHQTASQTVQRAMRKIREYNDKSDVIDALTSKLL